MSILLYNKKLDDELRKKLEIDQVSLSDEHFIEFALSRFRLSRSFSSEGLERAEYIFYILMQVSRRRLGLFPTPDICLALFNILAKRHDLSNSRLVCLNLGLLPVAVLASGLGAKIATPPTIKPWPEWFFSTPFSKNNSWTGAMVLGHDPAKLSAEIPHLPDHLTETNGGLIFCVWHFLDNNSLSKTRETWLEAGLLRSIIQLPRPRRQAVDYYPAIIEIGPGCQPPPPVRMAHISKIEPGPGGLSQHDVLKALFDEPDGHQSIIVPPQDLIHNNRPYLIPSRYLVKGKKSDERPLKSIAQIIRYQIPRTKLTPEEVKDIKNRRDLFLCREIIFSHFDEQTGFIHQNSGQWVKVNPGNHYFKSEYFLQQNDIILCFRGGETNIGRAGFIDSSKDRHKICGQSLCIIRLKDSSYDPVWLYYHLRKDESRQRILSHSSGTHMLSVRINDLGHLPIPQPTPKQVEFCNTQHNQILRCFNEIRDSQNKIANLIETLNEQMEVNE